MREILIAVIAAASGSTASAFCDLVFCRSDTITAISVSVATANALISAPPQRRPVSPYRTGEHSVRKKGANEALISYFRVLIALITHSSPITSSLFVTSSFFFLPVSSLACQAVVLAKAGHLSFATSHTFRERNKLRSLRSKARNPMRCILFRRPWLEAIFGICNRIVSVNELACSEIQQFVSFNSSSVSAPASQFFAFARNWSDAIIKITINAMLIILSRNPHREALFSSLFNYRSTYRTLLLFRFFQSALKPPTNRTYGLFRVALGYTHTDRDVPGLPRRR